MRRVAASALVLLSVLASSSPGHATIYGARRLGAVQVRFESGDVVAVVEAYASEGGNAAFDVTDPWSDYAFSLVCATVYSPSASSAGCGQGTVVVAWPLLDTARIVARVGSIDVDLTLTERGLPRPSPMLELGFGGPFAHGGLITFRPGRADGSVIGPRGGISGATEMVGLYSLTSAYGEPF